MIEGFSRPLILTPPKNHTIWVQYPINNELFIITTSGNDRTKYFLYKQDGKAWTKIAQSNNPIKLEEKVFKKR